MKLNSNLKFNSNKIIFILILLFSIFSLTFTDLNVESFNQKYKVEFSVYYWKAFLLLNPLLFCFIILYLLKKVNSYNITSYIYQNFDKLKINQKIHFKSIFLGFLYLLTIVFLLFNFESLDTVFSKSFKYNFLTLIFYAGVYEEFLFRFAIPNILFSQKYKILNNLQVMIIQAVLFSLLHNNSLDFSNINNLYAFVFNFSFSIFAYYIAKKNCLEYSIIFHILLHLVIRLFYLYI